MKHYDSHGNTQHDTNNKQFFNKLGFMFSTKPWMSVLYLRTSVLCSRTSVLSSTTDSRCLSQPWSYVIMIYVLSFIYVMDLPYEKWSKTQIPRSDSTRLDYYLPYSSKIQVLDSTRVKYWATIRPTIRPRIMAEYQIFFE